MAHGQRGIRRANLGLVLRRLAADGPSSRTRIAQRTGLNKTTVSSLVAELMAMGLLTETGEDERPGAPGRPARLVRVDGGAVAGIGLEAGVDALTVIATDLGGAVRHRARVPGDRAGSPPEPVLARLAALAAQAADVLAAQGALVAGVAVALPGLVDASRRELVVAPNLGWSAVPVADLLARALGRGLPVRIDNEANLAALAEHTDGAARGFDDVLFVSGSVGIGAAFLVGGELRRGAHGFAGELGHVCVDPAGARCACGARGCLETVAGRAAILRAAGTPDTAPDGLAALRAAAVAGQPAATAALARAGEALGLALAAVVNLTDPEAVVLGADLAPLTPWLAGPIADALRGRVLASGWATCEIRASGLGEDAAARGAAAAVLRAVLADPQAALLAATAPPGAHGTRALRYPEPVSR